VSSSQIQLIAQSDAYIKSQGAVVVVDGNITLDTINTGFINLTSAGTGDIHINTTGGGSTKMQSSVLTSLITGVNSVEVDIASGITLQTNQNTNSIDLLAIGVSSDINIKATENITLGTSGADSAIYPNINVVLNGTNRRTQYRGKETWGASLTPVPANLIDAPVYKHEWTDASAADSPIVGGSVVRQMGAQSYYTDAGVQYQQYNDGFDQVIIGKPEYNPGVLGGNRLGLFVNTTGQTVPPQFSGSGGIKENPSQESFRVDGTTTKISNNLIFGGENGTQVVNIDPLWDSPNVNGRVYNITVESPYIQVNIGTFTPVNSAAAVNSMTVRDQADWEAELRLMFNNDSMIHGQQVTLEVNTVPSKFVFSGAIRMAEQYGKLNIFYQNMDNGGVITQKSAGFIETDQADIINFGGNPTTYIMKTNLYNFSFSNMGQKTFYNGNGANAAGGVNIQKGWSLRSISFITSGEENNISYNMAPIASS
jgi:hypothetical protein